MKFEEGNSVEILKGEDGPSGLWFPGCIISEIGDCYVVKYDSPADSLGEPAIEKVKKEDVRPEPPYKRGKRWMIGDVAQVFDIGCWRVGKIVKVLKKRTFLIRLFGSIQLKQFHESSLRIWQAWHKHKWSVVRKSKAKFCGSLVYSSKLEVQFKDTCLRKKDVQKYINGGHNNVIKCLPVRMENRSNIHCLERSSKDLLSCVRGSNLALFRQAHSISCREGRVHEEFDADIGKATTQKLKHSSRIRSTEDSDQCSVASCSSNNLVESNPRYNCNEAFADSPDNSDAQSSCRSSSRNIDLTPYLEEKLEADVHELEFHAYKSTVQALYASGPLSWEQESLLTNLRVSLHISDEEHLLQLRHLLSTQVL